MFNNDIDPNGLLFCLGILFITCCIFTLFVLITGSLLLWFKANQMKQENKIKIPPSYEEAMKNDCLPSYKEAVRLTWTWRLRKLVCEFHSNFGLQSDIQEC
jgi:hypothetical protein